MYTYQRPHGLFRFSFSQEFSPGLRLLAFFNVMWFAFWFIIVAIAVSALTADQGGSAEDLATNLSVGFIIVCALIVPPILLQILMAARIREQMLYMAYGAPSIPSGLVPVLTPGRVGPPMAFSRQRPLPPERRGQAGWTDLDHEWLERVPRSHRMTDAQVLDALLRLGDGAAIDTIATLLEREGYEVEASRTLGDRAFDLKAVLDGQVAIVRVTLFRRWRTVMASKVQALSQSLELEAQKATFITASTFEPVALDVAREEGIETLDGTDVSYLLKKHGLVEALLP